MRLLRKHDPMTFFGHCKRSRLTMTTFRKTVRNGLIIVAITSLLLIIMELLLRTFSPGLATDWHNHVVAYQINPDYGIELKANLIKEFPRSTKNGGQVTRWRTNSRGYRGAEFAVNPGYRIVVYGDSNIQARFSNRAQTFTARLRNYLSPKTTTNVEVINAGVAGFGPDQSLVRFKLEAGQLEPDLVVFHIFADNDFGDIIKNRLFDLVGSKLVRTAYRITPDEFLNGKAGLVGLFRTIRRSLALNGLVEQLNGGSTTDQIADSRDASEVIAQLIDRNSQAWSIYQNGEPRSFSYFADFYDIDIAIAPESDSATEKLRLMEAVLIAARDAAARRNIRFLILIQPSVIDLTKNFWIGYEDLRDYASYDPSRMTAAIDAICVRNQIDCINLHEAFTTQSSESLFFHGANNHWNDTGQDLAARIVADYIARRFPLPAREAVNPW